MLSNSIALPHPNSASIRSRKKAAPPRLERLLPSSRSGQVVEQLSDLILSGQWKADELLPPERDLAEQLGVSRSVVREAAKILESRGLLKIRHGIGTMVNARGSEPVQQAMSIALHGQDDAMLQLTEVRLLMEVEVASLAAQRATDEDTGRLRSILAEMQDSLDDPQRYVELDMAFHAALAQATHNSVYALMLDASAALSRQVRERSLSAGTTTRQSQQMHKAICEAVEQRDAKLAARHMAEHLEALKTDIQSQIQ